MYTEAQARTIRCCGPVGCGNWFPGSNKTIRLCVASDCMGWQWKVTYIETHFLNVGEEPEPNAKAKGWRTPTTTAFGKVTWTRKKPPVKGYCGLAGKEKSCP